MTVYISIILTQLTRIVTAQRHHLWLRKSAIMSCSSVVFHVWTGTQPTVASSGETLEPTVRWGGPWTPTSHRERPRVPNLLPGNKWWTPTVRGQSGQSVWTDLPASGSNQSMLVCFISIPDNIRALPLIVAILMSQDNVYLYSPITRNIVKYKPHFISPIDRRRPS